MGRRAAIVGEGRGRRPAALDASDPRVRAHLVTTAILVGAIALIAIIWIRPILLLWVFLAVIAVMAYAAIYLLVSARLVEEASLDLPPEAGEADRKTPEPEDEL